MSVQKSWTILVGVVFLLLGALGFFLASPLFRLFAVNFWFNFFHIIIGIIFLWAAFSKSASFKPLNQWFGVIFIFLALVGFLGLLNFLEIGSGSDPNSWFHLILGIISLILGWFAS